MSYVSSRARQFTIKQTWTGPKLYVRHAVAVEGPGNFEWSRWRKARLSEIQMAIIHLAGLNQN